MFRELLVGHGIRYVRMVLLLVVAVVVSGCPSTDPISPLPQRTIRTTIAGVVTISGPREGIVVGAGDQTTTTDHKGAFTIGPVSVPLRAVVRVEPPDNPSTSVAVRAVEGDTSFVEVQLRRGPSRGIQRDPTQMIRISTGGYTADIPANSIRTLAGGPVQGNVYVTYYTIPIDPQAPWLSIGDNQGINNVGDTVVLRAASVLRVRLASERGDPLVVDPSTSVSLTYRAYGIGTDSPETLPLWKFDSTAAIWRQAGELTRDGGTYVGTATLPGDWLADLYDALPQPALITVRCSDGTPLPGVNIRVGSVRAVTDASGVAAVRLYGQEPFQMKITDCRGVDVLWEGRLDVPSSFRPVDQTITVATCPLVVRGTVIGCNNAPEPAEIRFNHDDRSIVSRDGTFAFSVARRDNVTWSIQSLRTGARSQVYATTGPGMEGTVFELNPLRLCQETNGLAVRSDIDPTSMLDMALFTGTHRLCILERDAVTIAEMPTGSVRKVPIAGLPSDIRSCTILRAASDESSLVVSILASDASNLRSLYWIDLVTGQSRMIHETQRSFFEAVVSPAADEVTIWDDSWGEIRSFATRDGRQRHVLPIGSPETFQTRVFPGRLFLQPQGDLLAVGFRSLGVVMGDSVFVFRIRPESLTILDRQRREGQSFFDVTPTSGSGRLRIFTLPRSNTATAREIWEERDVWTMSFPGVFADGTSRVLQTTPNDASIWLNDERSMFISPVTNPPRWSSYEAPNNIKIARSYLSDDGSVLVCRGRALDTGALVILTARR
ncbi:MAG: hypothetical protein MUC47_11770 [Candidatus Kapabacteria bacterium]|nr:hypothetical protein [Candidatus Kapabacteria bacterium]